MINKQTIKAIAVKHSGKVTAMAVFITAMVSVASATVTEDLANFSLIATNFVELVNTILAIFLTPPLIYFVFLGIFVSLVTLVKRMMSGGGKR